MISTPCVIFAGGKSSRMGQDKSLLAFGGYKTLAEFQYQRLSKIFKEVYISTKSKEKFSFSANFIEDSKISSTYAPTLGFVSAFERLDCDSFFAISVDAPFISNKIIESLIRADKPTNGATIASSPNGMEPLCGIYHRSLYKKFKEMLQNENHKLGMLLKSSNTESIEFSDSSAFMNLNHPHEYEKALKLL